MKKWSSSNANPNPKGGRDMTNVDNPDDPPSDDENLADLLKQF